MDVEHDIPAGVSRRALIRGAAVTGAAVWVAPGVTSVASAHAAGSSSNCGPSGFSAAITYQDFNSTTSDLVTISVGFEEKCSCDVLFANWKATFSGSPMTGDLTTPIDDQVAVFRLSTNGDFPAGTLVFETDIFSCCPGVGATGQTHLTITDTYDGSGADAHKPPVVAGGPVGPTACP